MGIQTRLLTHNSDGSLKESHQKDYIDFSFDGKYISEFDMVAVFDGDRHSFNSFPDFQDETSEINGTYGQYFWGTNIKTIKRSFTLATDGVTEAQINAFKKHFQPGKYGKFIEDHLAYRYSYCRIAAAPSFSVVPFRRTTTLMGLEVFENYYKGEIKLEFEWDNPYYYSVFNYIEELNTSSQTQLRAILNDSVPYFGSWQGFAIGENDAVLGVAIVGKLLLGAGIDQNKLRCYLGKDKCLYIPLGSTTSELIEDKGYNVDDYALIPKFPFIYYNPSTIETAATLELNFTPYTSWDIAETGMNRSYDKPAYFVNIRDKINAKDDYTYNQIRTTPAFPINKDSKLEAPEQDEFLYEFKYTTPNIISSLHKAIKLGYDFYNNNPSNGFAINFEQQLREEIIHDKVLRWSLFCLNAIRQLNEFCDGADALLNTGKKAASVFFCDKMKTDYNWAQYFNMLLLCFLAKRKDEQALDIKNPLDEHWECFENYTIIFNGETAETTIQFSYNDWDGSSIKFINTEEKCGDIVLSPYIKLNGGDTLRDGKIASCHFLQFLNGNEVNYCPRVKLRYKNIFL